ncbi:MAG: aminotransferase class IV family protein, partial [Pseudomonadota bacterium]
PGLKLIETLLWDGANCPRLALHQARLVRSAAALGWAEPVDLRAVLTGLPAQALRLRVTLDGAGNMALETAPLPPATAEWRVGLASDRLNSADPWLRHKTTRRAVYDAARAALPTGLDEVIFLNERGEVCEGTITTVFFDRGAGMRTPPLASGVLPGVLRAELGVAEEVLLARDLPHVRLWVGNALRGVMPARFFAEKSRDEFSAKIRR